MGKRAALIVVSMLAALAVPTGVGAVGDVTCDLNGDGRGEFLWGDSTTSVNGLAGAGSFTVTYSKASGVPKTPDIVLDRSTPGIKGDPVEGAGFGSTGTCGDFNGDGYDDLAVGVPYDSVGEAPLAGAVNVIPGSASGLNTGPDQLWHQDKPGVKDKAAQLEFFGAALTSGDYNGDGYDDLAIGVWQETVGGMGTAGAANVLYGSAAGLDAGPDDFWHQNKKGIKGKAGIDDRFGEHLNSGDFNGDGYDDLVVGVPGEMVDGENGAGAINLIFGSAGGLSSGPDEYWHQNKKGIKEVAEAADSFGQRTAVGDFNGDGYDDLAVGVGTEDRIGVDDGVVHVIPGSSGGLDSGPDALWHQNRSGIKGVAAANDLFGFSVAAGDFNNDGHDDLAIGVPGEEVNGFPTAGAVNVIPGSNSGLDSGPDKLWHQEKPGVNSAAAPGESFGLGIVARNYNGDNYVDLVIAVVDDCRGYVMFGGGDGLSTSGDQCVPVP